MTVEVGGNGRWVMASSQQELVFIGAILSIALGFFALRLIRKNKKLSWNESIAGHLIALMFICKGIQNAATGYFVQSFERFATEGDMSWQFWGQLTGMMDYAFGSSIIMISLIYPVPLLRNEKQLKIGATIIISLFVVLRTLLDLTGNGWSGLHLFGALYILAGLFWGSVYIKFRLTEKAERNKSTMNIAIACGLLLTLQMGHIWMLWPGLFLQSDYFYFVDLGGGPVTSLLFDYIWLAGYTFCIAVGLSMLAIEIYQAINGNSSILLYIILPYFVLGTIGHAILSSSDLAAFGFLDQDSEIKELWKTFTTQMHFTILRSLIAMYILLKYGFFDVNEETRPTAKLMTIILIVVATSAVLELIQSIIPINQMLTAALLGIIIAFGIGWEERSFDGLVANPANIRDYIDKKWFPSVALPDGFLRKLDYSFLIFILICILVSLIVWQTDGLYELMLKREGGLG